MFDQFVDSLKEKIDDISTKVDEQIKESRDQIKQGEGDKSGLFTSFIGFVDETNDAVAKMFDETDAPNGPSPGGALKTKPPHHTSATPTKHHHGHGGKVSGTSRLSAAGSSGTNLDEDDLYGYNISDDSEEDGDVGDMPLLKFSGKNNSGGKGPNLSDLGGQPLPRYALPSVYVNQNEVCKRRVTTTKRITEADLSKDSPLYRHRAQVQGEDSDAKKKSSLSNLDKHKAPKSPRFGGRTNPSKVMESPARKRQSPRGSLHTHDEECFPRSPLVLRRELIRSPAPQRSGNEKSKRMFR